jgi:DNA-binding transcriptional ArsR family regulator
MSAERSPEKIFKTLPEDGTSLHFEELLRRLKDEGISRQTLSTHLKPLVENGAVIREATEIAGRPRITYRRAVFPRMVGSPEPGFTFSSYISYLVEYITAIQDEQEQEKEAARHLNNLLADIVLTIHEELMEHAQTDDKEQAGKRLDSVIANVIAPMIKETTRYSDLPAASSQKVRKANEKLP